MVSKAKVSLGLFAMETETCQRCGGMLEDTGSQMNKNVRELFQRYEELFRKAMRGEADVAQVASSYATAFVAASPLGVLAGQNDDQLEQVMQQGFEAYR